MTSSSDILRRAMQVAAALAAHPDLPELRSIGVWSDEVIVRGAYTYTPWEKIAVLTVWARVFDANLELSLSYGSRGDVDVRFEVAGHRVRVTDSIGTAEAYQLGAALRMPLSQDAPIIVSAERMSDVLAELGAS